jgi:folate-binding protein YgfZ
MLLRHLGLPVPAPLHLAREDEILVLGAYSPTVPRFELWAIPEVTAPMEVSLLIAGAAAVDFAAVEALRILEGTPLFGADIRDRDLPQETGQDRALHFSKGCYLGQEIVERIRSRGAVHRLFTSFSLEDLARTPGPIPDLPAPLEAIVNGQSKPVGELTSAASMSGGATLALGYVRREARERNLTLLYPGGRATPIPLHAKVP